MIKSMTGYGKSCLSICINSKKQDKINKKCDINSDYCPYHNTSLSKVMLS